MNAVTLQINITADDYKHCKHLLKHQFDLFHDQVDEVLLTFDSQPQKLVSNDILAKNTELFYKYIEELKAEFPKIKLHEISYSKEDIKKVTSAFFNREIPTHDYRGAPIYGYLFGIYEAKNDYVIHLDSDMFFGGMSKTWIKEAIELLESDCKVLCVSPLPGPPHPDKILKGQSKYGIYKNKPYYFTFDQMSTRIFLFNKSKIKGKLKFYRPTVKNQIFSKVMGFANIQTLEITIGNYMRNNNLLRIDFKGNDPGLWSVHPLLRCKEFYDKIPEMIERVVVNDVPETQLGFYNFSDDFIDWSEAYENFEYNRLRNKLLRKLGLAKSK